MKHALMTELPLRATAAQPSGDPLRDPVEMPQSCPPGGMEAGAFICPQTSILHWLEPHLGISSLALLEYPTHRASMSSWPEDTFWLRDRAAVRMQRNCL